MNLEVRESKFPEELEEMKSKFSSEFSDLEKEFEEEQPKGLTEKDFYASLEKAQKNLDDKEQELGTLYANARSNLKEYQDNHYKSKQKFYKLLNHTEFNFNGWAIYGTSEEAEKNRSNFVDFVEKISNKYKCFMPQDKISFKEFIDAIGRESIEKYPTDIWTTKNKISEYFEEKTPDYTPTSKDKLKEKELEVENLKVFVEGLNIIKEHIEEGYERLEFSPYHLSSKLLEEIPNTLTKLRLSYESGLTDAMLKSLPRHLTDLNISGTKISDTGLKSLPRHLTDLDISGTKISDTGLKDLPRTLTTLNLRNTKITGTWLKDLPQNLTSLDISDTNITGAWLKDLPQNLTSLDISDTNITGAWLKDLPQNLTSLDLPNTIITEVWLKDFPRTLTYLDLRYTGISDIGLKDLPRHLIGLDISYTGISDIGLKDLPRTLTYLDISGTKISDTGLKWLEENMPNCKVYNHPH